MSNGPFEPLYGKRSPSPSEKIGGAETPKSSGEGEKFLSDRVKAEVEKFMTLHQQQNREPVVPQPAEAQLDGYTDLLQDPKIKILLVFLLLLVIAAIVYIYFNQQKQKSSIARIGEQLVKLKKMRKKHE